MWEASCRFRIEVERAGTPPPSAKREPQWPLGFLTCQMLADDLTQPVREPPNRQLVKPVKPYMT